MRTIGKLVLGIAVVVFFGTATTSALATSPGWQRCANLEGEVEGGAITKYTTNQCTVASGTGNWAWLEAEETEKIKGVALSLRLEDTKAIIATTARCPTGGRSELLAGPEITPSITKTEVENAKENCGGEGGCKEKGIESVVGVHLPWQTEFFETEAKLITPIKSSGAGEPGWEIKCENILGGKSTDTCTSEGSTKLEEAGFENVLSSGALLVSATFEKKHKSDCTEGKTEAGEIEGKVAFSGEGASSTEKAGLRVQRGGPGFLLLSNKAEVLMTTVGEEATIKIVQATGAPSETLVNPFTIDVSTADTWFRVGTGQATCEAQTYKAGARTCEFNIRYGKAGTRTRLTVIISPASRPGTFADRTLVGS